MKKIFVIGIVTIFLMTGLTAVTAIQTKTIDNEEENSAPVIICGPYEVKLFPFSLSYIYKVIARDADNDELTYHWDTDNDDEADYAYTNVNYITFFEIPCPALRVNVVDEHGAESGWSKKVSEAKSKIRTSEPIIGSIENLLDKFDWPFPVFRFIFRAKFH